MSVSNYTHRIEEDPKRDSTLESRERAIDPKAEMELREKALAMALDHERSMKCDVLQTARAYLAFLKAEEPQP